MVIKEGIVSRYYFAVCTAWTVHDMGHDYLMQDEEIPPYYDVHTGEKLR